MSAPTRSGSPMLPLSALPFASPHARYSRGTSLPRFSYHGHDLRRQPERQGLSVPADRVLGPVQNANSGTEVRPGRFLPINGCRIRSCHLRALNLGEHQQQSPHPHPDRPVMHDDNGERVSPRTVQVGRISLAGCGPAAVAERDRNARPRRSPTRRGLRLRRLRPRPHPDQPVRAWLCFMGWLGSSGRQKVRRRATALPSR
jgi:hypothetical protein